MTGLKERLGLVETIHVGVGVDRRRMRPPPGCMIVEICDEAGNMLMLEVIPAEYPAPPGAGWSPESGPATFVSVGETGFCHQAFSYELDGVKPEYMPALPDRFMEKVNIGATRAYIYWSCEENK